MATAIEKSGRAKRATISPGWSDTTAQFLSIFRARRIASLVLPGESAARIGRGSTSGTTLHPTAAARASDTTPSRKRLRMQDAGWGTPGLLPGLLDRRRRRDGRQRRSGARDDQLRADHPREPL